MGNIGDDARIVPQSPLGERPIQQSECCFYDLTLIVTPDVLIPRPDTERLVDVALEYLTGTTWSGSAVTGSRTMNAVSERVYGAPGVSYPAVIDLCCGSGCVGLAVAKHSPARVTYADISNAALEVARRNGAEYTLVLDALRPPPPEIGLRHYDALLCNPPYIALSERDSLDASVLDCEPHLALFAGEDGFDFYRSLLPGWLSVIKPGGLFAVETGYTQGEAVAAMARDAGLRDVRVRKDYGGHDRVVSGIVPYM